MAKALHIIPVGLSKVSSKAYLIPQKVSSIVNTMKVLFIDMSMLKLPLEVKIGEELIKDILDNKKQWSELFIKTCSLYIS